MLRKFLIFAMFIVAAATGARADDGATPADNNIPNAESVAINVGANENSPAIGASSDTGELSFAPTTNSTMSTCSQKAFAGALSRAANTVQESDPETTIRRWIYQTFGSADALRAVLDCPDPSCDPAGNDTARQTNIESTPTNVGANNYLPLQGNGTAAGGAAVPCPKISEMDDDEIINFPPVAFTFPGGRQIVVNYMTQPKILKQRLIVDGKRGLPGVCAPGPNSNYTEPYSADLSPVAQSAKGDANGDCASGKVGPDTDGNIWVNTEPAWYGIMVVQKGALDKYVGDAANNTISIKYIEDHLDDFYPHNYNKGGGIMSLGGLITIPMCTTQSSMADDGDIVNIATHRTTGEKDSFFTGDDFYVAGDRDLRWIGWAEVAADVAITVVTFGGGTAVSALTKSIRAARAVDTSLKTINDLRKIPKVLEFEKAAAGIAKSEKLLDAAKNPEKIAKSIKDLETSISKLDKVKDAEEIKRLTDEADAARALQTEAKTADATKLENELKTMGDSQKELGKDKDVQKYTEQMKSVEDVKKWQADLKAIKAQRGNVLARGVNIFKSARAVTGGGKTIGQAEKVARAGMKSGKIRDWLFANSLKFTGITAKAVAKTGLLYGAISLVENMYDMTQTSTGDYTSSIEFKPLLLLSADNLEGQENVVNHGMWFMFSGDSVNSNDDDAAYLQAMDFAAKFAEDMNDVQDELTGNNKERVARARNVMGLKAEQNKAQEQGQTAGTDTNTVGANNYSPPQSPESITSAAPKFQNTPETQQKFGLNNASRMAKAALNPAFVFKFLGTSGTPAGFCDVDIYVVRPIIKNPTPDGGGELYYLIMNDQPWQVRQ